jgi:hypothetical protein
MLNSGDWEELVHKASTGTFEEHTDDESTYVFFKHLVGLRSPVVRYPLLRSGEHVLRKLKPGDDYELLDEASEFLAVNTLLHNRGSAHPTVMAELHFCTVVWGATWGSTGKTALEHMAEQHNIALSGGVSTEFVLDPVIQHDVPARNLIDLMMASKWTSRLPGTNIHGSYRSPDDPGALRQLTYLHLAVSHCDQRTSMGYHYRREQWAKNLLQRYLLASGLLDESDRSAVARASINDLRTIVSTVLDVFQHHLGYGQTRGGDEFVESFFCDTDLPADFDGDVWPQLGWNYGLLFAKAIKRYGSQDHLSKTLARQWLKEGTMWQ